MVNFGGLKNLLTAAASSNLDAFRQISLALDVDREELTRHSIAIKVAELTDDLGSAAMRPNAEYQIIKVFRLCGGDLQDYQQKTLSGVFQQDICGTFISLGLIENLETLDKALKQGNLVIAGELDQDQKTFLEVLTKSWNERLTKAVKEVYLLALFSCEAISPLVEALKAQHTRYNLPIITCDTFYQEAQYFRDIEIVPKIFDYHKNLNALKRKLEVELQSDSSLKEVFMEVLEKPGLLFFENNHNASDTDLTSSSNLRLKLRKLAGANSRLDQILTDTINTTALLVHQLESEITYKHKQLRPDLSLVGRVNLIENLMLASTSAKISYTEKENLAAIVQKQIDLDPILGTGLSKAISIEYPKSAKRGLSKLALKIYQAVDTQTNQLQNVSLGLEIPDLKNRTIIRPKRLEGLLLGLMDKLAMLDSRSKENQLSKAGQQAITLLTRSFSVFDQITNFGSIDISAKIDGLDRQPAIMQFAKIWWLASSLEESFKKGLIRDKFFDNIQDWLSSYNCMTNFQQPITFTELAGIAPLVQLIGDIYEDSEAQFVDSKALSAIYKKFPERIKLLPSGLQAVFGFLSGDAKNNLMYLVRSYDLIIDEPSLEAILLLKTADRFTMIDQINKLKELGQPIRLSLLAAQNY